MDLKIKEVSELLQLSEAKVRRLIHEGQIPAYRLNREYRFNRAEIEDWLMQKGLKKKEEKVDFSLGNMQFSLFRAIYRGSVLTMKGKTKEEILLNAITHVANRFNLDADGLFDLFMEREKLMSTALGHGIAVPHTRDFLLSTHYDVVLVVFPEEPIDYSALDNQKVHSLFFLFAAEDKNHLHLLSKVAYFTSNEEVRRFLTTKPEKEALLEYIKQWESTLSV